MTKTVFVSSTFVDLKNHRKAVWDLLAKFDVTVRGMEAFGARSETPLETCIAELEQSDIYLGIIAFRHGSLDQTSGKSFTQLEYERALELKKEILIYLVDEENALFPVKFIDHGDARDKLQAFKRVLRERHTIDSFRDEDDLAAKIKRDLERMVPTKDVTAATPTTDPDEFDLSRRHLERFWLLPQSISGTETRLVFKVTGKPYPASRAICEAFNLQFGATVGLPVKLITPAKVDLDDLPDLYASQKIADSLLPVAVGDTLDGYVKLHFFGKEVPVVQAKYRTRTSYSSMIYGAMSGMAEPVTHEADSQLAFELSKTVAHVRNNTTGP